MREIRAYGLLLLATILATLPSCQKEDGAGVGNDKLVPVQMALSIGQKTEATKGNPAVITEMSEVFRGMTSVTVLPFTVKGVIQAADQSIYHPIRLRNISPNWYDSAVEQDGNYVDGLVKNNRAHIYPAEEVFLPAGTASLLVYGCAPLAAAEGVIPSRQLNGALEVNGLGEQANLRRARDIYFDPVPILTGAVLPGAAQSLANLLNTILAPVSSEIHDIRYTTPFWYEDKENQWHEASTYVVWNEGIEELLLRECYVETTNRGNMIPGSGRSVEYMIGRLYRRLKTHVIQDNSPFEYMHSGVLYPAMKENGGTEPLTWGDLYEGLKNMLIDRIEALNGSSLNVNETDISVELSNGSLQSYPQNLGLPDGAAILRWNGIRFYPVADLGDNSEEGVAPVTSYCYPPQLWYFANSTLSTSSTDKSNAYNSENTDWESDILSQYHLGKTVSSDTESVALDEPLRYSCGMLKAEVVAATENLTDRDETPGNSIHLDAQTFPVTGVIIGSQQRLNFDFTPAGGKDYFLYDNCISNVFVPAAPANPSSFLSLVSQTPAGKPVYLCLELQNNSGQAFTGADGIVLPGSKFYLVGSIEAPSETESVFKKHSITTIQCTILSLKEALNAIPNLEEPHISIGVLINADWTISTPGHIILS